ncbi:hypothetical protein Ancab_003923 [Ancistrocladus abbreviatus]
MESLFFYRPYIDPEVESLIERIHPARVCIDNDAYGDCTLVKVDSPNKHGILLEMVQILTDLELVISKSYISSDGGWFMDVFHVTDQSGNKITDESLILYIKQALCATRRNSKEVQTCPGRQVRPCHVSTEHTALELTMTDQPGLLSEVTAVLAELGCHVSAAVAWTHSTRAACIIYVEDELKGGIIDLARLGHIKEQLQNVVEVHHRNGERRSVRLAPPAAGQTHTERRLHQLMADDKDYETCSSCGGSVGSGQKYDAEGKNCDCTYVSIENCKEKGYSMVNVRSRDRTKLFFDTVCTLTDMQYVVFHAAITSKRSIAVQEYYIRHKDGRTLDSENERHRVAQCLAAAVERRASHGLRLDISAENRLGLLSDITRVFREYGLSVSRAEMGTKGEKATGTFYVTDTSGHNIKPETLLKAVKQAMDCTIQVTNKSWSTSSHSSAATINCKISSREDNMPKQFSLRSLLLSQLERLSSNFSPIKL